LSRPGGAIRTIDPPLDRRDRDVPADVLQLNDSERVPDSAFVRVQLSGAARNFFRLAKIAAILEKKPSKRIVCKGLVRTVFDGHSQHGFGLRRPLLVDQEICKAGVPVQIFRADRYTLPVGRLGLPGAPGLREQKPEVAVVNRLLRLECDGTPVVL